MRRGTALPAVFDHVSPGVSVRLSRRASVNELRDDPREQRQGRPCTWHIELWIHEVLGWERHV